MLDLVGDAVSLLDGEVGIDGDGEFGAQTVPNPPHPHLTDTLDAGDSGSGLVNKALEFADHTVRAIPHHLDGKTREDLRQRRPRRVR